MSATVVFTSVAANYLPKARVLAHSLKRTVPEAHFCLMLVDNVPSAFSLDSEPFDSVLSLNDLGLENPLAWAFSHSVVELCTAVKGLATRLLLQREGVDRVFYFDPDMVLFGRFDELERELAGTSILLTPHQSEPESDLEAVMDNEMASLKHGVFNMGFFGVANTPEGRRFAEWWSARLEHFCVDDIGRGLFTDQKWANLIPCFFEDYRILRSPAFNVATWNITTREVQGSMHSGFTVNSESLGFYHFSGFDSGDQALMLNKYGAGSAALRELREWYIATCQSAGQNEAGTDSYSYASFSNGDCISPAHRRVYRNRIDLQREFPDPFAADSGEGYQDWYRVNIGDPVKEDSAITLEVSTPTSRALSEMSVWLRQRALLHQGGLKRFVLLGLAKLLRLFSKRAS